MKHETSLASILWAKAQFVLNNAEGSASVIFYYKNIVNFALFKWIQNQSQQQNKVAPVKKINLVLIF